jgi:hypothetical protein
VLSVGVGVWRGRRRHRHAKDDKVTKNDAHIYSAEGVGTLLSVTAFKSKFFEPFDLQSAVDSILKGRRVENDPSYKFYKKTKDEILQVMDADRLSGIELHRKIELYYN